MRQTASKQDHKSIEIEVAPNFGESDVSGVLHATVIVRFDGPVETIEITVLFPDRGGSEQNKAAAISAARQLAL